MVKLKNCKAKVRNRISECSNLSESSTFKKTTPLILSKMRSFALCWAVSDLEGHATSINTQTASAITTHNGIHARKYNPYIHCRTGFGG